MIQNADINIGPANYKDLAPDELLVTSIFFTIQGEGPHAGKPALFIRLAGCNRGAKAGMGCEFCDTKFTFVEGERLPFSEITARMHAALVSVMGHAANLTRDLPLVVITGGEPMMQDNLVYFIARLDSLGFRKIQIESNGDRIIPALVPKLGEAWPFLEQLSLVVSPKVTKKGLGGLYWYRPLKMDVEQRATALKFVISGDPASSYFNVPDWAHDFPREVYLSPMAEYREGVKPGEIASGWDHAMIDPDLTKRNYKRAAELAMSHGFRVSIQQHLFLGLT